MASITVTEYAVHWDIDDRTNHISMDRSVPEEVLAEIGDRYIGQIVTRTVTTSSWAAAGPELASYDPKEDK